MILTVLLPAAARGTVIILIAWIVATVLRSRPASLRHTVWSFAIVSQIALPIVALLLPQRTIDMGPVGTAITGAARSIGAGEVGGVAPSSPSPVAGVTPPSAGGRGQAAPATIFNSASVPSRIGTALDLVAFIWLVGALLMVVRFIVGTVLVAREMRRSNRPVRREWVVLAGQIQEEMELRRDPILLWGSRREVPYTWGVLTPVVCLPADADKWSIDRLRIVMIHELAHVERFDTLGELVAQIALVIFWFNPLLWLAVRRMRTEREHACDDRVLTRGVKPSTYVEELVNMMKSIGNGGIAPGFGAIAMARRTQFEARMFAVLDERTDRHAVGRRSIFGVAAAMVVLLLVVASVRPATASPVLQQVTASSGKVDTWEASDFDDMVADCKSERPKNKPRIGVRYCEVRTVDLSALSGAIDFRGGYLDGVIFTTKGSPRAASARALIRAEAVTPDDARKLASQVRTVLKDGVLQSEGPGSGSSNFWSVLYEVTLPVGRSVTAQTENGQISLADFAGTADVSAVNGPIEAFGAAGDIRGHTANGPLIVGLGGNRWEGAGLDFRTANGPIFLSIPENYSAHLITGTVNGPMDLRHPLMVTRMKGKRIETDIGGGGTTVRVTTENGPADIR